MDIVRKNLQDDGLEEVVQLADVLVARQGALVYRIQFVTVVAAPVVGSGSNAPREIQNVANIFATESDQSRPPRILQVLIS